MPLVIALPRHVVFVLAAYVEREEKTDGPQVEPHSFRDPEGVRREAEVRKRNAETALEKRTGWTLRKSTSKSVGRPEKHYGVRNASMPGRVGEVCKVSGMFGNRSNDVGTHAEHWSRQGIGIFPALRSSWEAIVLAIAN